MQYYSYKSDCIVTQYKRANRKLNCTSRASDSRSSSSNEETSELGYQRTEIKSSRDMLPDIVPSAVT